MPVTNQTDSARYRLFGTLSTVRFGTRERLNLDDFEGSESYLYFFRSLEQCNTLLELIVKTLDGHIDSRMLQEFWDAPIDDGVTGGWRSI